MSDPTPTFLLDKSVVRRLLESLAWPEAPLADRAPTVAMWRQLRRLAQPVYISVRTANVLARLPPGAPIAALRSGVGVLMPSRYAKRWARRIGEHGFTREDAALLSLGTFGTDEAGSILGVSAIITLDRPLINHYWLHHDRLARRLAAMTAQLLPPFHYAALPDVLLPQEILRLE